MSKSYNINYLLNNMYHTQTLTKYNLPTPCDSRSETSTETDQPEPHTDQHIHPIHTDLTKTASSKAKSSLCRNFTQKGYCPYDKKCQFAHGPEQLRINMETNRSYKTEGCHSFIKKGHCSYGQRCNFIHYSISSQNSAQKWNIIYQNHIEVIKTGQVRYKSRLLQLLGI